MSVPTIDQPRAPRLGDRVQGIGFPPSQGRIVENLGPIGHKGRELYGVEIQFSEPTYTVMGRDDFFFLDDGNDPDHPYPPPATE